MCKLSLETNYGGNQRMTFRAALLVPLLFAAACSDNGNQYTLYRSSVTDADMRVHIATFDSADGDSYNSENCLVAAGLFARQPGVSVRYWCEKGPFRK